LRLVFEEYFRLTGKTMESAIESEMSGSVKKAFLALAVLARCPPEYFATRIAETMIGSGTDDNALIRNVVMRCDVDMVQIKQEFQRVYGKTLASYVKVKFGRFKLS
jgi:hypothetical protein